MKIKHIVLRNFKELDEALKVKVLETYRDINTQFSDFETYDLNAIEEAKKEGFDVKNFEYSGFWSQGDGARIMINSFKGNFETPKKIKELLDNGELYIFQKLNGYGNYYSHANTFYLDYEIYESVSDKLEKQIGEFVESTQTLLRDLSNKLYRELEDNFNYLQTDERIIDTIEINEYLFNEEGEIDN